MPSLPENFALLDSPYCDYDTARTAIQPIPFERTTSYGKGTAAGPHAIIRASQAMELYDEELASQPFEQGIATLAPFLPESFDMESAMAEIAAESRRHLEAGKFLVTIGGEHSLSIGPVRAAKEVFGEVGVVQFDAHADLRDEFEGSPYSHASVMRRILDEEIPTLAVGIRSLSAPEAALIRERSLPIVWGQELGELSDDLWSDLLTALPENIYLTFDIDYFDPALVPATGTPEPGGGAWYSTLGWLRRLFADKTVVAMDLVELAPIGGQPASDFVAAKTIYKCLAYR